MKRTIIVLALLVATLAMPLLVMHNAEAQSYPNLSIEIGGPNNLAINATSRYSITMSGGPAQGVQDGWWSYEATLEMSNQTGNPKVTPAARNGTTNVFIINVTAPAEEQVMLLRVTGTSNSLTENQSRETVYEIKIVRPLVLSTTVTNNGEVSVSNVPVVFYANGREVAKTTVSLSPGETKKVSVNWTSFLTGEYVIEARIDPEGKFFGLGAQDTIATKTYYVGEPSSLEAWVYGTILVAVGFLTVLMVLSARQSKRPAPKWKK